MPSCPTCHIFKGLWSPMSRNNDIFVCSVDGSHRFTRDREGNFHKA